MHDRVPGQAAIEHVLLRRGATASRSRLERALGIDPLDGETRAEFADAIAQRAVAARLAGLPDGWTVLHSLPIGRGGGAVDHLVIGPGGVFTVDVKRHVDASAWVAGRTVLVPGARRPHAARAAAEARKVDRIAAAVLEDAPVVRPVVAVVGAKRMATRQGPAVVEVLRAEHLRRWLRAQPVRLTPGQVAQLVHRFEDPATWQPTGEAGPALLIAFARLSREVRAAARTRLAWAVGLVLLTAGGAAAMITPGLVTLLR